MSPLAYAPEARMLVPAGDPATAWTVILDPSAVATARTALSINAGAIAISQDGIDWGQAAINAYEADLQKWGSTVVDFRVPNRMVTINLLVGADNSGESGFYDAAMSLRQKVALFQREGGWIQRGFDVPMYADIVSAALTFADQYGETGFLESNVILTLECLPDFYGDEIALDPVTVTFVSDPLQLSGEQAIIEGDHPGRCRIIITNGSSSHGGDQIIWGFRSRYYDSGAALLIEAEDCSPVGGATSVSDGDALAGHAVSYTSPGGGWNTFMTTDAPGPVALTHKGTYRLIARCSTSVAGVPVRLVWGPSFQPIYNDQVNVDTIIGSGAPYQLLDLGVVHLERGPLSPSTWTGSIQTLAAATVEVRVDCFWLQPLAESGGYVPANALDTSGVTEIRTEGAFRKNQAGTNWDKLPTNGDLPRIPPSGLEGRPVELFVKTTQGEIDGSGDLGIDLFEAQIIYRPSYVFRP